MGKTHKHFSYDYEEERQTKKQLRRDKNRRKEKKMKNAFRSKNFDLNVFEEDDYME